MADGPTDDDDRDWEAEWARMSARFKVVNANDLLEGAGYVWAFVRICLALTVILAVIHGALMLIWPE